VLFDGLVWAAPASLAILAGSDIRAFAQTPHGRLWIASDGTGLACVDTTTLPYRVVARVGTVEGLPSARVHSLHADGDGAVWAGTHAGLALLRDGRVARVVTEADGLPSPTVWGLCGDGRGRVWVGTKAGLAVVGADGLHAGLDADDPAHGVGVHALGYDPRGTLWVGLVGGDILRVAVDAGGRCGGWGGAADAADATGGMARLVHRSGARVRAFWPDRRGHLWVGTSAGVILLDAATGLPRDTWTGDDGLPAREARALCGDRDGRVWAGTLTGLALLEDRAAPVRALPRPSTLVFACRADGRGRLWLGTRRGVARYTPATGRCLTLGRSLGLPSEECNSHALFLDAGDDDRDGPGAGDDDRDGPGAGDDDRDGPERLWVGTVQGVGIVETARIAAEVPPCAVHLTGFAAMGQERELTPGLEIEESDYDLAFSYGAVTLTAAPQVVYRVQLVGLEEDWSAPTAQRVARYTNLRPGAYTFRVAARNWGGQWSVPVAASFRVVRNRQARELEEALERERLDKEVAQATAAVFERLALQDGLTGLLNRRALDERLVQEVDRARRHAHPLTVALADVDRFKRINDTYGHLAGDEVLKVVAASPQDAGVAH